ncbi:MAG: hypothetical protein ACD_35C00277G0001, partial [uncultured bacterium]
MVYQPYVNQDLQKALDKLLNTVSLKAKEEEEKFFFGIKDELCELCKRIAVEIGADSTAVFFVTENNPPGIKPYMVMRGASGRLRKIFDGEGPVKWKEWKGGNPLPDSFNGFAYPSKLPDELTGSTHLFQEIYPIERQVASEWSATTKIWHLAEGLIANSNRAMDELHGGPNRMGHGDSQAYKGENLYTTFRTMVGVPIFAQGGDPPVIQVEGSQKIDEQYPPSASSSTEFLSKYRVIGILKLEGKLPIGYEISKIEEVKNILKNAVEEALNKRFASKDIMNLIGTADKNKIIEWCKNIFDSSVSLNNAFQENNNRYPEILLDTGSLEKNALVLRKAVADVCTRYSHAEFTRQDLELLVLLAMQVGRLMTRRVMKHAADNDIVVSETEVGLLNIHWRDINQLVALHKASEVAKRKVSYHLDALKDDLDTQKRQAVFRARVSEFLDPHGPIRDVDTRRKETISLIRKLVRKQRRLEEDPQICEVSFTDFKCEVEDYGSRSGDHSLMKGSAKMFIHRPAMGYGKVDMNMKLGVENAPHIAFDKKNMIVALRQKKNTYDSSRPLIQRILDPLIYGVDDLAGARIITDYDSDIDDVLDELRIRVGDWGMELGKVD